MMSSDAPLSGEGPPGVAPRVSQGKLDEAEELGRTTCDAHISAKGAGDIDSLLAMNALARVLKDRGGYSEAEHLFRQAEAGFQSALAKYGDGSTGTLEDEEGRKTILKDELTVKNNLAELYQSQGRATEAEALLTDVYSRQTALLGEKNPLALITANNLALLLIARQAFVEVCERTPHGPQRATPSPQCSHPRCPAGDPLSRRRPADALMGPSVPTVAGRATAAPRLLDEARGVWPAPPIDAQRAQLARQPP